jgi:cation diffusion facilitator CzcD-associated flavoprotein CzcO
MATERSRAPAFPIAQLPGELPLYQIEEGTDPLPIAQASLIHLQLLDAGLLKETTLWRDLFALTGTARTFDGVQRILGAWRELNASRKPHDFKLIPSSVRIMRPNPKMSWIEAMFSFHMNSTPTSTGTGVMKLVPDEQTKTWRLWTLVTMLQNIDNLPNVDVLEPNQSWQEEFSLPSPVSEGPETAVHDCVVVGAGMSGLCVSGNLKAIGVNTLILERNSRIGQNWTDRYDSVSIHTSRPYGQLPFAKIWGPEYPYHLNTNHLDEGYRRYAQMYNLNVSLSTELKKAHWNPKSSTWTLEVVRHGQKDEIVARHLVLALGGGGQIPKIPELGNKEAFNGTLIHTANYKNANQWAGKRGVVIGTANSGHDVSNDMLMAGLSSVTMVQRSRTPVLPVEFFRRIYDKVYNDDIPVEKSDMITLSTPTGVNQRMAKAAIASWAAEVPERYDSLERQGFRVERNMDLYHCLFERFGSHYIDVGVSQKVSDGLIKVKSDAALVGFNEKGLVFSDGSMLDADVVVLATGFEGNMRLAAADIVGEEVSEKLEDWWGVDCEGELRGAWKPIGRKSNPTLHRSIV